MTAPLWAEARHIPPGNLTFEDDADNYSVYRTEDDEQIYLAHGIPFPYRRIYPLAELDVLELWMEYNRQEGYDFATFQRHLQTLVTDPVSVAYLIMCEGCDEPGHQHAMIRATYGYVCEGCNEDYRTCERCERRVTEVEYDLNDHAICQNCRDHYYRYCEDCEGYYHADYQGDHRHACECDPPTLDVTIRNNGHDPLIQDVRTTVPLPSGTITEVGMQAIARYLRNYRGTTNTETVQVREMCYHVHSLGNMWQTREGNFPKRLSRYAYKNHQYKLPQDVLSEVGNIGREHSIASDRYIEITRALNMRPDEFANGGSCWWGGYYTSRCALKSNGGFGIRSFRDAESNEVTGRAWVLPVRHSGGGKFEPTFDAENPDAFIVFNPYGDMQNYVAARVVAHMAGRTYRQIRFAVSLSNGSYNLSVNGEQGWLVGPEELVAPFTDGTVRMALKDHANLYETEQSALAERTEKESETHVVSVA